MTKHATLTLAAAVGALLTFALPASAATLAGIHGDVMVNAGYGFQPVRDTVSVKVGDLVLAGPGSSAQLAFADGCMFAVKPDSVVAITERSPCATQARMQTDTQVQTQQAANGGSGQIQVQGAAAGAAAAASGGGVGGGAAGAGAVGAAGAAGGGAAGWLGALGGLAGIGPVGVAVGAGVAGAAVGAGVLVANTLAKPAKPASD